MAAKNNALNKPVNLSPQLEAVCGKGPLTRAQVRAELVQLEKAGYNPNDWINYPENIQAAQAKIAAAQNTGAQADATGYGSNPAAASQSGQRVVVPAATDRSSVFFGH